MDAIEPNIKALAVFAAAWLICCAAAIQLSGMLPLAQAPRAVRSGMGAALLFVDIGLLVLATALTVFYCFRELRWTSIVVVGGAVFLFSPFITQDLPETFKNSKSGLAILALALAVALAILFGAGAQDIAFHAFSRL